MRQKAAFKTYRYHLVPIKTDQLSIFGTPLTVEELKQKKNELFAEIISASKNLKNGTGQLPVEIDYISNDVTILKLAVDRKTTLYKDFKEVDYNNQPFIYILINNHPEIQKILIEDNKVAFYDTNAVRNILQTAFSLQLARFELTIHIEPVVDKTSFWEFVRRHEKSIQQLDFDIVKPNLANISKSLKPQLKELIDITNSHKTNIKLQAPTNGVLENINQKNSQLNSLVEYSNEGGGDGIKMKIKGVKKKVSTKNMIKEIYIDYIEVSNAKQQKLIDNIEKLFD